MELSPFLFGLYKLVKYLVYPYTWLCLFLALLAGLTLGRMSPRRMRAVQALAIAASAVVFGLGLPVVAGTLVGLIEQRASLVDLAHAGPFDAIVVLGAGVKWEGSLRPRAEVTGQSLQRTFCGAELYTQGLAPRLVLAGGDASVFGQAGAEAVEMERVAVRLGVPEGAIVLETRSRNTYENAVQTRRLLGRASVLVVTSASHLPRAQALFRKQGLLVTGYPCGYEVRNRPGDVGEWQPFDFIPTVDALAASTAALNEVVGMLVYWVFGKL